MFNILTAFTGARIGDIRRHVKVDRR